ncbi:MAG: hypothetical protein QHH09_01490 [Microgenomates group bacterium]|nr:hypothetical protein [Microgenomates group bacterium]
MKQKDVIKKIVVLGKNRDLRNQVEFIGFVGDQFKNLLKKNLNLPIKLYHL